MTDTITGMLAKIAYLWADGNDGESDKVWTLVAFFVILFVTIFVLLYKEKKKKRLDPNYRPFDLGDLYRKALPVFCYIFAINCIIYMVFNNDAPIHVLLDTIVLLALGRVLTLLEQRVDKSPSGQADAV